MYGDIDKPLPVGFIQSYQFFKKWKDVMGKKKYWRKQDNLSSEELYMDLCAYKQINLPELGSSNSSIQRCR